jgi:RNA polymerase subunit RPABC4/transcription elongation factor Spt4
MICNNCGRTIDSDKELCYECSLLTCSEFEEERE